MFDDWILDLFYNTNGTFCFLNYNIMKRIVLVTLLCALTLQQTVLVSSGVSTAAVIVPLAQTIALEPYHTANHPNHLPGAQWIWKSGGQSWAEGDTATFQSVFYADCSSAPVILKITADNEFSASLNGGAAVTGKDWTKIFTFTMSGLVCGANKLQITVVNRDANSPAALIFLIQQDQSQCYQCATTLSFYNRNTCQCECTKGCSCTATNPLFQWKDYPVCGCQCAQTLKCNDNQYFNQNNCGCQCKPKACLSGFKQDPQTCGCITSCPEGRIWSSSENKCVCSKIRQCAAPYFWNDKICDCERRYPIDPLPCPANQIWNMELKKCVCSILAKCQSDYVWNENSCKCEKKYPTDPIPCDPICPPHKVWNTQLSKCTCLSIARCAFPYSWNEQTCNCEVKSCPTQPSPDCTPRNCGILMTWDTKSCSCVPLNINTPIIIKPAPPISITPYPLPPAPAC